MATCACELMKGLKWLACRCQLFDDVLSHVLVSAADMDLPPEVVNDACIILSGTLGYRFRVHVNECAP